MREGHSPQSTEFSILYHLQPQRAPFCAHMCTRARAALSPEFVQLLEQQLLVLSSLGHKRNLLAVNVCWVCRQINYHIIVKACVALPAPHDSPDHDPHRHAVSNCFLGVQFELYDPSSNCIIAFLQFCSESLC